MAIPASTLEEIKGRTDLADLISSYGIPVRRMGADYKACCPFHHEKTPSFVIHPDKGYYHCFGCGESGSVFDFVMKQEGLTFIEAVKKLAQQCGVKIEEKEDPNAGMRSRLHALHAELAEFFRRCLKVAPEAKDAREYLASRELSDEIAEKFCIGYAPKAPEALAMWAQKYKFTADEMHEAGVLLKPKFAGGRPFNRFAGRLMFTIRDRAGRPVAFSGRILTNDKKAAKYVNSPETLIFKKSNILFALDQAAAHIVKAPRREAIVCEGQIDVIRCHACGFPTAVASQGTAFTSEHVQILKKVADSVTLVFDADGAGQKAAIRTGGEFLAAEVPVRVATLPPGEDPDSLLRTKGPEAFRACLDDFESITHFQVRTLLAKEERPDSLDAVARVSRAALETIALCPSAVLRATLMAEAAQMLNLPVAALEEDFRKVQDAVRREQNRTQGRASAPAPSPARPPQPTTAAARPAPSRPAQARPVPPPARPAPAPRPGPSRGGYDDLPPEDFYIDVEPPPGFEEMEPVVRPAAWDAPSPCEKSLCELLVENEQDAEVRRMVASFLPDGVLQHGLTCRVLAAWRKLCEGDAGAIGALRGELEPPEREWLDRLMLGNRSAAMSEVSVAEQLEKLLRQLWMAAVRKRQGELPAASSPETDRLRLAYSTTVRQLQRAPWAKASSLMVPATLA